MRNATSPRTVPPAYVTTRPVLITPPPRTLPEGPRYAVPRLLAPLVDLDPVRVVDELRRDPLAIKERVNAALASMPTRERVFTIVQLRAALAAVAA